MRGFNSLLGSHYDHYYLTYNNFNDDSIPPETFQIDSSKLCDMYRKIVKIVDLKTHELVFLSALFINDIHEEIHTFQQCFYISTSLFLASELLRIFLKPCCIQNMLYIEAIFESMEVVSIVLRYLFIYSTTDELAILQKSMKIIETL